MVAIKPNDGPIAMYDPETGDCTLAEGYMQGIRGAIPKAKVATDAFWLDLTDMVSKLQIMKRHRAARPSRDAEIKYWERILKLATKAMLTTSATQVMNIAEARLRALRAFPGGFSRKINPNNEALYYWVLEELWCKHLGQQLGVSTNYNKVPGPLVRFFSACVNPLFSKPLTPSAIVSIRDRVRKRRENIETTKVQTRKRIKAK
jgi:hypothetical protein